MINSFHGLSSDEKERVHNVSESWNEYAIFDEPGGTTREVLRALQNETKRRLLKLEFVSVGDEHA